jgi:hypothetical protein
MGPLGSLLLRPQLQWATLSRGNGLWASSRCNSRYSGCIGLSRRSFSGCNAGAASVGAVDLAAAAAAAAAPLSDSDWPYSAATAAEPPEVLRPSRASRRAWLATERRQTCMLREAAAAPEAPARPQAASSAVPRPKAAAPLRESRRA